MKKPDSGPIHDLVALGVRAIPDLIRHLNDNRPSNITVNFNIDISSDTSTPTDTPTLYLLYNPIFGDHYDYNPLTTKPPHQDVKQILSPVVIEHNYTFTVGDLCAVVLGEIVNRNFNIVRSDLAGPWTINSPSHSEALRAAITKEWGNITPEQHRESLVQDFLKPDYDQRRMEACVRLDFYYPEALIPLVLKQLSAPRYDRNEVISLIENIYQTSSARQCKKMLDTYIAKHGEVSRQGILEWLFSDLDRQELIQKGDRLISASPGIKFPARDCLIQLLGYPKSVKSQDDPHLFPVENFELSRFIDDLAYFPNLQIDQEVRRVLQSTKSIVLCTSCLDYLMYNGENVDADIRQYVNRYYPKANKNRRADLDALQDRLGWTPLHFAVARYATNSVTQLLQQGADVNIRATNGQTPLHVVAKFKYPELIQTLLEAKANPNLKDSRGRTPIQLAEFFGNSETVHTLLAGGAEPTDVLAASYAGRADLIERFLKKDPRSIKMRTQEGETALLLAADLGYIEVLRVLIAHGADVNYQTPRHFTALQYATASRQYEAVRWLLQHDADPNVKNDNGGTPLSIAKESNDEKMIRLLNGE